ncbi:para-aminobenzoate synthase [Annulohypoxylon truncatum]|uniref:para-aminobenzoate synthase n=1 Tax=Annulohypoxylon truncatum TaxID=327061 RepID=UPI0020083E8B|nr:para-aminobenzoate synthase [Annulohypoxylon truncatum]KAI1214830.1 para-aminobenzoate synthase [Annulohypoxylon truncatum]
MNTPRILFIDAYDSFSNNIVSLLTTTLDAHVDILPIDPPQLNPKEPNFAQELTNLLRRYDAVVCGPGPGSPELAQDVGLMRYIWDLEPEHLIPVLGICLGFQSLVVSCGGIVKKLRTGLHGMIREIDHATDRPSLHEGNIFYGISPFKATLYHSLHADIGQDSISAEKWACSKWASPAHLPDVVPLAWVYEDRGDCVERILMAMKHRAKPFWGLQYHPESICTEPIGHQVIKNWFNEAMRWNVGNKRITSSIPIALGPITELPRFTTGNLGESMDCSVSDLSNSDSWINNNDDLASSGIGYHYGSRTLNLPIHIEAPDVVEILQGDKKDFIILDSASAKANRIGADVRGRYSIIALDVGEALKLEYRTGDRHVILRGLTSQLFSQEVSEMIDLGPGQTIWQLLAEFWAMRKMTVEDNSSPFVGGFMGYTTYELGLEGIDVESNQERLHNRPDLCFAWVTKSIVIDHTKGAIRLQYLSPSESKGRKWADSIAEKLHTSTAWLDGLRVDFNKCAQLSQLTPPSTPKSALIKASIQVPDADEYESKVRTCQDYIASGDSYELCLTDQTHITRPRSLSTTESSRLIPLEPGKPPQSSWQLYRSLRSRQPAPFGSYIRLGGATLISSSPERFLEFGADGLCSMRPMKGTVRKSRAVSTLEQAEAILHVPKEEAENLMIVDLVRHDLHRVCGPGRVEVPKLNIVEEYASVFQMISVVEGRLPEDGSKTGLDVLAASLPPGSMTGAPKKRSCEILQEIEGGRERSLYSGVVGYMDAAGKGDWSVTIRSLFRWDDERVEATSADAAANHQPLDLEVWHIGAGGAVTALSTAEGERDEMFTKLKGPLGVFDDEA